MLVELHGDDLTKLSGEIGLTLDLYEAFFRKKFVKYLEKKVVKLFDHDDFEMEREIYLKFHTYLAFVHLFPEVSHQFEQPTICYFKPESYHELGVITKSDPLTFMHVTYAQFLVARYILRVLTTGNLEHLCPKELFYNLLRYGTKRELRDGQIFDRKQV